MVENKFRRRSIRLPAYDYSQYGWYFVTICTRNKAELFGDIRSGGMMLSEIGMAADKCWRDIPSHFPHVVIDEYVVMPNHTHGIVVIMRSPAVGAENFQPLRHHFQYPIPKSLSSIVRGFKIGVTTWCRNNGYVDFQWQRNYFERIIRDDAELENIQAYIRNNPTNWTLDDENPLCQRM